MRNTLSLVKNRIFPKHNQNHWLHVNYHHILLTLGVLESYFLSLFFLTVLDAGYFAGSHMYKPGKYSVLSSIIPDLFF